jgi:hypothetical protein
MRSTATLLSASKRSISTVPGSGSIKSPTIATASRLQPLGADDGLLAPLPNRWGIADGEV